MEKNIARAGQAMDDNKCMRIACWVTGATNAHSAYEVITSFFKATMVKGTGLNVTLNVQCLS